MQAFLNQFCIKKKKIQQEFKINSVFKKTELL